MRDILDFVGMIFTGSLTIVLMPFALIFFILVYKPVNGNVFLPWYLN
jgi:hypothetical protein